MNRVGTALALIGLAATGVAAAQNMPSQPSQAQTPAGTEYPSSSAPSSSEPGTSNSSSDAKAAMKQQVKDCMAQQKANNSSMSKHELKKYCKNQVENTSGSTPHG